MRLILFILPFIIIGCSSITSKDPLPYFNMKSGVFICRDDSGNPIKILPAYQTRRARNLAFAQYNVKKHRREIGISITLIDLVPSSIVEFAAYHECGHHQLHHVDTSTNPKPMSLWSSKLVKQENDADCFAARVYLERNGQKKFEMLINDFKQTGFVDHERVKRIEQCN